MGLRLEYLFLATSPRRTRRKKSPSIEEWRKVTIRDENTEMRSGEERVKKRGRKIEDLKGENKEESEKGWGKRGGKKWREDFGCIG